MGQRVQEGVGDLLHQTGYSQRCLHPSGFWQPLKLCDTYLTFCQLRPEGNHVANLWLSEGVGVSQDTGGGKLAKKSDQEVGGYRILD